MTDDAVREDIAFIRRVIEEGRGYASARSPDLVVWGIAITVAYLGNYAAIRGWWSIDSNWLWALCTGAPWIYSMRRPIRRFLSGTSDCSARPPMGRALGMIWIGCGIVLSTLALALTYTGEIRAGWFSAVTAAIIGLAFFASSYLCNLAWMRWVAVAWWVGELVAYAFRHRPEVLLISAGLTFLLLAVPGAVLLYTRPSPAVA